MNTNRPTLSRKGIKIAVMNGVREHTEHDPVELWLSQNGRMVIRAYNECSNNFTEVDLRDLLDWMQSGEVVETFENDDYRIAPSSNPGRD